MVYVNISFIDMVYVNIFSLLIILIITKSLNKASCLKYSFWFVRLYDVTFENLNGIPCPSSLGSMRKLLGQFSPINSFWKIEIRCFSPLWSFRAQLLLFRLTAFKCYEAHFLAMFSALCDCWPDRTWDKAGDDVKYPWNDKFYSRVNRIHG